MKPVLKIFVTEHCPGCVEALRIASGIESESEHPIARGIVKTAEDKGWNFRLGANPELAIYDEKSVRERCLFADTVDGLAGRLQRQTCGYNAWEVALIGDGRVTLIYWLGSGSLVTEHRVLLDRVLSTFRFGPGG